MNINRNVKLLVPMFVTAGVLLAWAPLHDRVKVQFSHSVHVNDTVLSPGRYVIQEMRGKANNNNVLEIYGNDGQKLATTTMTVDTFKRNPPRETEVVLERLGNDYYLHKVW